MPISHDRNNLLEPTYEDNESLNDYDAKGEETP